MADTAKLVAAAETLMDMVQELRMVHLDLANRVTIAAGALIVLGVEHPEFSGRLAPVVEVLGGVARAS